MVGVNVVLPVKYSVDELLAAVYAELRIDAAEIQSLRLVKRTLVSAEDGFFYKLSVAVECSPVLEEKLRRRKNVQSVPSVEFVMHKAALPSRPVVVGFGPAGIFAALSLAEAGARPIVLERGDDADTRASKVAEFQLTGRLDPESNIQFGEGGAGTFSDGKLKPGKVDGDKYKILSEFVVHGAPEEIMYDSLAHVGTDRLVNVVRGIREKIISLGGEVIFRAKLTEIIEKDGAVAAVRYEKDGRVEEIAATDVILATGHSARDVFALLSSQGVPMEQKGFGIGVRLEHPQRLIDRLIYKREREGNIGAASYHLVTHLPAGRSVYSFCMCPGGEVMTATSEEGAIVTNGGSRFARDGDNANAAILVSVTPADFRSDDPMAGIELQRQIERRAYSLTEGYRAPAQRLCDFMDEVCSRGFGEVKPTYARGIELIPCEAYLPDYVCNSIRSAMADFEDWMPGYLYGDAMITGPETRTTSPIRITRGENCQSPRISGLYPCGEGAGYAGGIISSAVDGIRCARAVMERWTKTK